MAKNPPANAGGTRDPSSIPGSRGPPGGGNGSPLQDSWLENSTDRGAWWAPWGGKESDATERLTHRVRQVLCGHQGGKREDEALAWFTPTLCPSALTPPHSLSPALYSGSYLP